MINALRGRIVEWGDGFVVVLTACGIEYYMEASTNSIQKLRTLSEKSDEVRVLAHMIHREDAMLLYAFSDEKERTCFLELMSVNGIGAKQSLKILSSVTVEEFVRALNNQDVRKLSKIPGVGQKTGQKLILQLRNVLVLDEDIESSSPSTASLKSSEYDDIIESIVGLGYERKSAREKVMKYVKEHEMELFGLKHQEKEDRILMAVMRGY